jgi:hypothetical protein
MEHLQLVLPLDEVVVPLRHRGPYMRAGERYGRWLVAIQAEAVG